MRLIMSGTDIHTATVREREPFAFSERQTENILGEIKKLKGVCGAVLLVTCNRTELYISCEEECTVSPKELLIQYANRKPDESAVVTREENDAALHLIETACGLHSKILHDEQITSQIRNAAEISAKLHCTDSVTDTLFRTAVSAGKYSLANVNVSAVPRSASYNAVQLLETEYGTLKGKKAVVIGSGNMGKLAAELLLQRKCNVFITVRSYHKGDTTIPFGAVPIPYENRFSKINEADIVLSATRSPHYTVTANDINMLEVKPKWLIDLAVPRDIEPECSMINGINYRNIDDFGSDSDYNSEAVEKLHETAEKYLKEFIEWKNYRESVPYISRMKEIIAKRIIGSTAVNDYRDFPEFEELVTLVSEKTTDMIMGGIRQEIAPELLQNCCEKIESRARY